MTKLLDRPLKVFAIYSLIILLLSVPAYFLAVDFIWLSEIDEHNQIIKERIENGFNQHQIDSDQLSNLLEVWNNFQPGISIEHASGLFEFKDSIYDLTEAKQFTDDPEVERFRGLQSYIEINGQPYKINIETNLEEADETLLAITLITIFFFIVLIIGFIILNRRISLKAWKPFYQTLNALKTFDLSKGHGLNLESSGVHEFEELNASLQKLTDHNISVYLQQKSFTENASHELQTPIALLKSKLDLLLQETELTPKITEILNGVEAPLSRLSRINKNLLLLAKVENNQYAEVEKLKLKTSIENALGLFEDYLSTKKLKLEMEFDEAVTITANPFLLETLINNILSNAIRHTPEGGLISIRLKSNALIVSNSGSVALDSDKLFKRFSTSSKEKIGSGLGLSIVKEIINNNNWNIEYSFQKNLHSFSLTF